MGGTVTRILSLQACVGKTGTQVEPYETAIVQSCFI